MLYDSKAVVQKKSLKITSVLICKCKVSRIVQLSPLRVDRHIQQIGILVVQQVLQYIFYVFLFLSEILKKKKRCPRLTLSFSFHMAM